jgi:hypothetical protein
VHLAFVKLDREQPADLSALHSTLAAALAPWQAEVLPPADDHARAAWDVGIVVRGEPEALAAASRALSEALEGFPVGAAKGWSFEEGA